jgi:hypothetical protein
MIAGQPTDDSELPLILARLLVERGQYQAEAALEFLLAQHYLEMGLKIGSSDSSKVMFMDPRSIPGTLEGLRAIVGDQT